MSHLYVIDDQVWSWLTYEQMALWHAEDEEWLKAREAAANEAERRYYSVEASMERCMASARTLARIQFELEARRAELARELELDARLARLSLHLEARHAELARRHGHDSP